MRGSGCSSVVEHLLSNHGTLHSIPNTARGKKLTERKRRGGKEEETREKQEECEWLLPGRVSKSVGGQRTRCGAEEETSASHPGLG